MGRCRSPGLLHRSELLFNCDRCQGPSRVTKTVATAGRFIAFTLRGTGLYHWPIACTMRGSASCSLDVVHNCPVALSRDLVVLYDLVRSLRMAASFEDVSGASDLLTREIARRRTFAIISHPDAGKTTLTEKLLLYAGAIDLAGAVRGQPDAAPRRVGLDGDGAAARHLDQRGGARVRARGAPRHAARHARATRTSARTPTARCSRWTAW